MSTRARSIGEVLFSTLALAMLAGGCGKFHMELDSSTNWLKACDGNAECGELSCLCGACNMPCSNDDACSDLNAHAECLSMAQQGTSCGRVEANVCALQCNDDAECGAGLSCTNGMCADPVASAKAPDDGPIDAGTIPAPSPSLSGQGGSGFKQLAVGGRHGCVLGHDGTIQCWGSDYYGTLANIPAGSDFVQIAAGGYHSCALRGDGSLICWGAVNFDSGQVAKANADGSSDFVQITAGNSHTCALRSNGTIICWGDYELVRDINTDDSDDFVQVAGGYGHSCALRNNGSVHCWGGDTYGQVTLPNADGGTDFVQVAAGAEHTCALRSDASLTCWGMNEWVDELSGPNDDTANDYIQVMASASQTCGLHLDGSLSCWGDDFDGQVSGANAAGGGFIQVGGSIEVDGNYICALAGDGTVSCWGEDVHEQISGLATLHPN